MASLLRFPRPRTFLHIVSLRTATEFIHFTLLINKLSGLYGILAIFTGYHLNPLQLSHYIYSLVVLGLVAWLSPSVRQPEKPLRNLALAWIYVLDAVANSIYTGLFGAGWFLLLAQTLNEQNPLGNSQVDAPGADTMNDTAGFTDPEHDVTHVVVVPKPNPGLLTGEQAVAYGSRYGSLGDAVFQSGSMASISVLALLWLVRFYFCIIVMSYARGMLRRYVASTSTSSTAGFSQPEEVDLAENPFKVGREEGEGWKGKLGRLMLRFPTKRYWLGRDEAEEAWVKAVGVRFEAGRTSGLSIKVPGNGVGERERRARSGTGPPPLTPSTKSAA